MPKLDPPPQPPPRFETAYLLAALVIWMSVLVSLIMPPARSSASPTAR